MNTDFEYAIVGAGGMGSTAAYYLAREGKSVIVLEQFDIGHNRGASHGESRIIRYSYEWPDYVKLAKAAFPLWDEASNELGFPLRKETGGLDLGYPDNPDFDKCIKTLIEEKVPHEVLDSSEIGKRYPQFNIGKDVRGLYQHAAGYIQPDVAVPSFLKLAQKHSAMVKGNTTLDTITLKDDYIEIGTNDQSYRVKKLILTLGPWASPLLETLGVHVPIKVTLEQYAFFTPEHPERFQDKTFPVFIAYVSPGQDNIYGLPLFEQLGVKVAEHRAGAVTDAKNRSFEPDEEKLARLIGRAKQLLPDLKGEVTKVATCLYANTPDYHFVIDKLPGNENVVVATGFSGHGYKFVPIVGSILKDLAIHGQTDHPIGMFKLSRFASLANCR